MTWYEILKVILNAVRKKKDTLNRIKEEGVKICKQYLTNFSRYNALRQETRILRYASDADETITST